MKEFNIELTEQQKNCDHDWVYSNYMLTSNPPQCDKICKKCGLIGRDRLGECYRDEYSETIEKFKKVQDL